MSKLESQKVESEIKVFDIPVKEIYSDAEFNSRGQIVPIDVVDLAKSIEAIGLQAPIVVQPFTMASNPNIKWRIVSGHRRHGAYLVLKKKSIPCIIKEGLDEKEARFFNIEENLKRKDLNILQEARTISNLQFVGATQQEICRRLDKSISWVQTRLLVLQFASDLQKEIAKGILNDSQIRSLKDKSEEEQVELVKRIKNAKMGGEKIKNVTKKSNDPKEVKHERKRKEIYALQDKIYERLDLTVMVPVTFGTRCLAWCAGEISDADIETDIQELSLAKVG